MDRVPMPSYLISLAGAAVAGALVIGSAAAAPGAGAPIEVLVDHAKVMHIARPADIVIIGNPGIADATIQDSQTLIITGHSYGTTNLIVLDAQGQAIAEELVSVQPNEDDIVTVYKVDKDKGAQRESFACNPTCAPALSIGDANDWFNGVRDQIQARGSVATPAGPNK
jgi:Flp pilus assembly secretin CpaC